MMYFRGRLYRPYELMFLGQFKEWEKDNGIGDHPPDRPKPETVEQKRISVSEAMKDWREVIKQDEIYPTPEHIKIFHLEQLSYCEKRLKKLNEST